MRQCTEMAKASKPRGLAGRPTTGVRPGEKASDYKRLMLRLPADTLAEMDAAARATGQTRWRVVVEAVRAYIGDGPTLSDAARRLVRGILKLPDANSE